MANERVIEDYKGFQIELTPLSMNDGRYSAEVFITQNTDADVVFWNEPVETEPFSTCDDAISAGRVQGRKIIDELPLAARGARV